MSVIEFESNTFPNAILGINAAMKSIVSSLTSISTEIQNLNSNWTGKRYSGLVALYNGYYNNISIILAEGFKICQHLESIANSYSVAALNKQIIEENCDCTYTFDEISYEEPEKNNLKFISSAVETSKTTISTEFSNISTEIGNITSSYGDIVWNSTASTSFGNRVSTFTTVAGDWFTLIGTEINNYVSKAISEIKNTETTNTMEE